jgi:ADP-ribose pyrophosphatase YjhB (NUDIX family)
VGILAGWRFCPRCRAELAHHGSKVECRACGFERYANALPATSALVVDRADRILLARRAHDPDGGLWDTLGGFLEEDEHPEAGLRREVLEEAGVEIEVGPFVGAYPDRYGDGDDAPVALNLVWEVTIRDEETELTPADDVAELRWFPPDALPADDELAFRWLAPALRAWVSRDL